MLVQNAGETSHSDRTSATSADLEWDSQAVSLLHVRAHGRLSNIQQVGDLTVRQSLPDMEDDDQPLLFRQSGYRCCDATRRLRGNGGLDRRGLAGEGNHQALFLDKRDRRHRPSAESLATSVQRDRVEPVLERARELVLLPFAPD